MGFFDDVLPRDDRHTAPERQSVQPAHLGPPQGWVLPTVLPAVRVLARSDNARIALVGVRCWPEGVSLDLHLMCRQLVGDMPEWGFRFGVLTSDGRRAAAREFPPGPRPAPAPDGSELVLRPIFGGGGRFHRRWEFYLWPLPPKGRLTMVADWPAEGIRETYTELDAGEIRSAAARAVVMWRDLPVADAVSSGAPVHP
ncbi:MAG TPA: hypothetical protein VH333_26105 [Pseudonocardiaceae bacterium]|jgi:hypothetical protein|nr:hypothetical protein [Pseudonocardiaceae bacterium]